MYLLTLPFLSHPLLDSCHSGATLLSSKNTPHRYCAANFNNTDPSWMLACTQSKQLWFLINGLSLIYLVVYSFTTQKKNIKKNPSLTLLTWWVLHHRPSDDLPSAPPQLPLHGTYKTCSVMTSELSAVRHAAWRTEKDLLDRHHHVVTYIIITQSMSTICNALLSMHISKAGLPYQS